jgi:hypothetical protein
MNAICERLIGTLRREILDRTLILNQAHLRAVLAEYQEHYNTARHTRASTSESRTLTPPPHHPGSLDTVPIRRNQSERHSSLHLATQLVRGCRGRPW